MFKETVLEETEVILIYVNIENKLKGSPIKKKKKKET